MRTIYFSLINSHLLYCQEIWGSAFTTNLQPIVVVQKKIIRLITGANYNAHTQPLFQQLKIRPIMKEIDLRRSILAFELVKNPALTDIEIQQEHHHNYRTRYAGYNLPRTTVRTSRYGTKGIKTLLIKAYNNLPNEIKQLSYNELRLVKRKLQCIYN
jgi:hypothetical protein